MTLEQKRALALAQARLRARQPKDYKDLSKLEPVDPTEGMSGLEKFNAGVGKAFVDVAQGAAQLVGMGPSAEEVRDRRELDAPLMNTGAGLAGNVTGNVAMMAPAAVLPGAASIPGAAAIGAVTAGLQPTEGAGERIVNMGIGTALGGGTQAAGTVGARKVGEWAAKREAMAAALKSQNSVRDATLKAGQEAGYTVPPSAVTPSAFNDVMESVAGKAAVNQEAAKRNQTITDMLARREAGLSPNEAISTQSLKAARKAAAAPYRELTSISPQAASDMEALKAARLESKLQWQHYGRSGAPEAYKAATQADQAAEALENALEQHAKSVGKPQLVDALRKARAAIAKNHAVDKATNVGTGSVDAAVLGGMLDRGAPLSGDLRTIAAFQQAFKQPMREASAVPNPGSSKLAAYLSGGLGAGGFLAGGVPGVAAAALPFVVPPIARSVQLARGASIRPDYSVSQATKATAALNDPATRQRLALALRAMTFPAIPAAAGE